jgi:hypothetical protein
VPGPQGWSSRGGVGIGSSRCKLRVDAQRSHPRGGDGGEVRPAGGDGDDDAKHQNCRRRGWRQPTWPEVTPGSRRAPTAGRFRSPDSGPTGIAPAATGSRASASPGRASADGAAFLCASHLPVGWWSAANAPPRLADAPAGCVPSICPGASARSEPSADPDRPCPPFADAIPAVALPKLASGDAARPRLAPGVVVVGPCVRPTTAGRPEAA